MGEGEGTKEAKVPTFHTKNTVFIETESFLKATWR